MHIKMILPALTEATSPHWRPIKYSLFPPLGLATLAGYLPPEHRIEIVDEHVEPLKLDDHPDLVVIQAYITSAKRAYRIADHYRDQGAFVALGGLHPTALPQEAAQHADAIFTGPGEDTWPQFLADFFAGWPKAAYHSTYRTLEGVPFPRRDLIKKHLYLVPNSIVVSRGCPHRCDFCYKESFFQGGKSYYVQQVDRALAEIETLPGKHLFFLDDHLFGNLPFIHNLLDGLTGMGRVWQAAGTVQSVLRPGLMEKAAASGLRSLFIGFETLDGTNLLRQNKHQNKVEMYAQAIERLHSLGVMINASFVFGMDHDDESVFERTVAWAVEMGIQTATFHILTPYPGTALYDRMTKSGRVLHHDWDLYDTRHAVFQPTRMTTAQLESGYWDAYSQFYSWENIFSAVNRHSLLPDKLRHLAYTAGWKKFEPVWDKVIRMKQVWRALPFLETLLNSSLHTSPVTQKKANNLHQRNQPETDG